MANASIFKPDYDGYDILCTSEAIQALLEDGGKVMAERANDYANKERGDTPYYATDAKMDKQTHKAVVFISNSDNHGFWDNAKNGTLAKARAGGDVI